MLLKCDHTINRLSGYSIDNYQIFQDDISKDDSESDDAFDDDVDDDASWGVVFAADDIDESDGVRGTKNKGKKKRRSVASKILVDQKLSPCKIEELDELGTDEEELPRVIGLAATPPQAINFRHRERHRSRLKMFDKGGESDCRTKIERKRVTKTETVVGSKFWIGSSSDMSSCSGNPQAKVHKNK